MTRLSAKALLAISTGLLLVACSTDEATAPQVPTSTALATTTTVATTSSTISSTTVETTSAPTTTAVPTPTDVVESRDGYDVLRNGGLLYQVESAPEFGGFELHIKEGQDRYGFIRVEEGIEVPQEVLFRDLLWVFGAQHPEYIMPGGGVDVEAYKRYLSEHDWVDTVYLPDNISDPQKHVKYPPVVKSAPLVMNFKIPTVISSGDLTKIVGFDPFSGFYEYYYPTSADNARMLVGMTPDGQFFFSYHTLTGVVDDVPFSYELGELLSITANITDTGLDPQLLWVAPSLTYWVPGGNVDSATVPDYERLKTMVLDIFEFVTTDFRHSALFARFS